jgi:hypothetical protein
MLTTLLRCGASLGSMCACPSGFYVCPSGFHVCPAVGGGRRHQHDWHRPRETHPAHVSRGLGGEHGCRVAL